MRLAGGSPSCRASARSSPRRSSLPSTTADSFAQVARWQRGSGSCRDNIRLAASRGSAASDDATIVGLCRTNETCRRPAKLAGAGPVVAHASGPTVHDGRQFRSGREMAAWIGLVPRQYTTGGKPRLGGIGRRANHYLRRQLIHGARAVVSRLPKHDDPRSTWLNALVTRRGFNRTIVALAN